MEKKKPVSDFIVDGLRKHALDKLEERQKEKINNDKPKEVVLRYPMFEQPERDYVFREKPSGIIIDDEIAKL